MNQLLNQMDEYFSNKPFKRRWWSRRWIVYMTIQPSLSKDYPLWKRTKDELRLLRLFDLTPEELRLKIERYWKMPRWRRWFASFGMNKKIDVWNYYQRCLAYQAIRAEIFEQESIIASKGGTILEDLSVVLHQANIKFEAHLEKRCRNPKWVEKHFSKAIKVYKQQIKKIFLSRLNKSLQLIKIEEDRFLLKQQAEQEFQQVEAFMYHYHSRWFNSLFPRTTVPNEASAQHGNRIQATRGNLARYNGPQATTSSLSTQPRTTTYYQTDISLHRSREWIREQRKQLNLLLQEDSLQQVEELLQTSLNDIKMITELHLGFCDTMFSDVQDREVKYHKLINYLDNLQRQLKPLLQGGMLLFHPDHLLNLTHSQAMKDLISHFSQIYLEQSRCYLDSLKNYHLRIEEFYLLDQQKVQRQPLSSWSDLAQRIQELSQSINELRQSFKQFAKELDEIEAQRVRDREEMEAQRVHDREALEVQRVYDREALEAQRVHDREALEVQRVHDREALEAQRKQDKSDTDAQINAIRNFVELRQQTSSSTIHTPERRDRFFKP